MFITFEGPEGGGKTTQIARLAERLRSEGQRVLTTRQPGGEALGKELRALLLDQDRIEVDPVAELMMMMADRAQSVAKVIRPALQAGSIVLCDRYADSSVAYQGYGRSLDLEMVRNLNRIATGGLAPDLTFLLDIDPQVGIARQAQRNRMEDEAHDFHTRVRRGFLEIAASEPNRIHMIDASAPIDTVARQIEAAYEAYCRNRA